MGFYPLVGLLLGLAGWGVYAAAALRGHAAGRRRARDRRPRARHAGAASRRPHGHGRRLPERRAARARPRDHEGQPGRRHGRLCRRRRDRRQGERARFARAPRRRPGPARRPERGARCCRRSTCASSPTPGARAPARPSPAPARPTARWWRRRRLPPPPPSSSAPLAHGGSGGAVPGLDAGRWPRWPWRSACRRSWAAASAASPATSTVWASSSPRPACRAGVVRRVMPDRPMKLYLVRHGRRPATCRAA